MTDAAEIKDRIVQQLDHGPYEPSPLYGDGKAGERIARLLSEVSLTTDKQLAY